MITDISVIHPNNSAARKMCRAETVGFFVDTR
jgi:hypothetical protein